MLDGYLSKYRERINSQLLKLIKEENIPNSLKQSMIYSIEVGGKRLRPILLFAVVEAFKQKVEVGYKTAAALEMIHTYSLIHDDLPAMDDDDLRRGKPTNHQVFGEATAILAGDGLLTQAFTLISSDQLLTCAQRLQLIQELSQAAGPTGMIAGQMLDMEAEDKQVTLSQLENIHILKTGRLIEFSIVAGGIIGCADEAILNKLRELAYHLGLAFQIKDDILDMEGDGKLLGKPIGSDLVNQKSTYVSLLTLPEAKKKLAQEIKTAADLLQELSINTQILQQLISYVKNRST